MNNVSFDYRTEFDTLAKEYLLEMTAAENKEKMAKQEYEKKLHNRASESEILAAQAEYMRNKEAFANLKRTAPGRYELRIEEMREQAENAAAAAISVNPEDVNMQTMELLRREEMLTARDYESLYNNSESTTMKRIIADSAKKRSESMDRTSKEFQIISNVVNDADDLSESAYMNGFNEYKTVFEMGTNNIALFRRWDEITKKE